MVRLFYLIILCVILSCSSGHNDKYGIYIPNNPNYTLKGKKGDKIPKELDTINVYEFYGYYSNNNLIEDEAADGWKGYKKFISNGRVYSFGTAKLEEKSLDPNYANKGYYIYNEKNKEIKHEVFTNGNGGQFVILKYKLSKEGDTLTSLENGKKNHVYIRFIIPKEWKKYKINW
ncbi:hypothetical protein SGQ83_03975 [Flavobacterium sp. Fl-318]|uniref:Lipoprotein n=1 Tax=Flavobacterium cupriresistens TaxID=2893885 RepID=A0ABU4R7D2_9FLAO|nr:MULTISPECIES: hypothetical protein [unclassified Flavobacterium]MDX6188497.1 hypothetical protein [Flavobacterium sp. Fl-318]UFH44832.1 hypothetical protein LNP23_11675 [Flavobacterium sp. F-323]